MYCYSGDIDELGMYVETLYIVHEFVDEGKFFIGGLGPPNPIINEKINPNNKPLNAP